MTTVDRHDPRATRPFSSGSECHAWMARNCHVCALMADGWDDQGESACPIETAIALAWVGSGLMPSDLAARAGLPDGQDCPEREAA